MATAVRLLQPEKASSPIEVTEVGMATPVRPEHPEKAKEPIAATLLPMETLVTLLQP